MNSRQLIIISFILMSCNKSPIKLVDNFYSYQNINQTLTSFKSVETWGKKEGFFVASISEYYFFKEKGKVALVFFEDQLASVVFYPKDTGRFYQKIDSIYAKKINMDEKFEIGNKVLSKSYDTDKDFCYSCKKYYVAWSDKRLMKKYDNNIW
jgi:hypothetical protein